MNKRKEHSKFIVFPSYLQFCIDELLFPSQSNVDFDLSRILYIVIYIKPRGYFAHLINLQEIFNTLLFYFAGIEIKIRA